MISIKKLIKMARKWQRVAAMRRKRISFPKVNIDEDSSSPGTSYVADKGHFVVYSIDQRRFVLPMVYLNNPVIMELLKMSEEEFGLPSNGPIVFPCDSVNMQYIISVIQRGAYKEMEQALSIATRRCSVSCSFAEKQIKQQFLLPSH